LPSRPSDALPAIPPPRPPDHALHPSRLAPTAVEPLPLHDALPIYLVRKGAEAAAAKDGIDLTFASDADQAGQARLMRDAIRDGRSEEHTSELQSRENLVCRRLLAEDKDAHRARPADREIRAVGLAR